MKSLFNTFLIRIKINFIYRKLGQKRVESDEGLPGELGSQEWCHSIQLTMHSSCGRALYYSPPAPHIFFKKTPPEKI
jgi:hypothetical protein